MIKPSCKRKDMLQNIEQKIVQYGVKPMDVIVLRATKRAVLDHYVIFLGHDQTSLEPIFIANYPSTSGRETVQFVSLEDLFHYDNKMEVSRIRTFKGSDNERELALDRALSCVNNKEYSFVHNNCEHFANYVQYGKPYSQQTVIASASVFALFLLVYCILKNPIHKGGSAILATAGLVVLLTELSGVNTFKSPQLIQAKA